MSVTIAAARFMIGTQSGSVILRHQHGAIDEAIDVARALDQADAARHDSLADR